MTTILCILQDAVVRQAAVTALLALYSVDDNISPLHAFTERFSTRFAELVYDVDEGVAVKGVRALYCSAVNIDTISSRTLILMSYEQPYSASIGTICHMVLHPSAVAAASPAAPPRSAGPGLP